MASMIGYYGIFMRLIFKNSIFHLLSGSEACRVTLPLQMQDTSASLMSSPLQFRDRLCRKSNGILWKPNNNRITVATYCIQSLELH